MYAHNVLVSESGAAKICDFGASFFYPVNSTLAFERMEMRAFGLLMQDLITRIMEELPMETKQRLVEICNAALQKRILFKDVVEQLKAITV